jgi:hypothetical protein
VSLVTEANRTSFLSGDDVAIVAHVTSSNAELARRFATLATELRDRYSFGTMVGPSEAESVHCQNNINQDLSTVTVEQLEAGGVGAMRRFVAQCAEPLVPELGRRNEMAYLRVSTLSDGAGAREDGGAAH